MKGEFAAKVYHLCPCYHLGCHRHILYRTMWKGKITDNKELEKFNENNSPYCVHLWLTLCRTLLIILALPPPLLQLRPMRHFVWWWLLLNVAVADLVDLLPASERERFYILFLCISSQCSFLFPSPPSLIALWCHYNFAARKETLPIHFMVGSSLRHEKLISFIWPQVKFAGRR